MAVLPASNMLLINYEYASILAFSLLVLGCSLLFVCKRKIACLWFRRRSISVPPGSFGLPWLGETLQFNNAIFANDLDGSFLRRRSAKFQSETFKTHIFMNPTAILMQRASANRFLANGEKQNLIRNSWAPSQLRVVGAHAPAAKHGLAHKRLRQILNSCLRPLALQTLVGRADIITQHHFASCWRGQSQLSLFPLLKLHTFRVACSLLASIEDEQIIARLYPLYKIWLAGTLALPINLPGTAFHRSLKARKALLLELSDIILRRKQELKLMEQADHEARECADMSNAKPEVSASTEQDLLSMLLKAQDEDGGILGQEELQDVLLFILFAGHDTTTAVLASALKLLEANPTCCDTLSQEHYMIFSQKKNGNEVLEWEDIQNMKHTWMVLQETMRLMPPVFGGFKEAMHDLNFDGYQIPKGWKIFYSTTMTHHDEKYFPKPTQFDPSRFDNTKRKDGTTLAPFTYIPFGIGSHSCPGNEFARMTTSIYLYHLVRNFKWISKDPNETFCVSPMPKPTKGYPAKILERSF